MPEYENQPFQYELGRLAYDPEPATTKSGKPIVKFKITVKRAFGQNVNGTWGDPEFPDDWYDVAVFGEKNRAKAASLRKGNIVVVGGSVKSREYNGKTYHDLTAMILQRAVDIEAEDDDDGGF